MVGRLSIREDQPTIVAGDIKKIEEAYKTVKAINVDLSGTSEICLDKLRSKLALYPGKTPVYLRLDTQSYKSVQILVGEDLFVTPSEILMNEIKALVGEDKFSMSV